MGSRRLIGPFNQILTMDGLPTHGSIEEESLSIRNQSGILCERGIILEIGDWGELLSRYSMTNVEVDEITYPSVLLPGFVDSHTHICWEGSRAQDYALRNQGKTYLEIAESGGGIWDTVAKTRNSTEEELSGSILRRISKLAHSGVTTVEVKSGYGLDPENEIKMLKAIQLSGDKTNIDIVSTCLAAHIPDKGFQGTPRENLELILNDLLPTVKEHALSNRVDIFVEKSAFSAEEADYYLKSAREMGFDLTVHADQFSTGGSEVAVKNGALSADHLEASTEKEIALFSNGSTVATVLPGASLGLGLPFAPARKLLDANACLAIASDWNPGSAPNGDLLMQASLLGAYEKLSSAEVIAGITFRAARALGLFDRGVLGPGNVADFTAFETNDYREIMYHQGSLKPVQTWKSGKMISK